MPVIHQPEEINQRWAQAFNARDVPAMLALYEDQAVLVPAPDAEPVSGHDAIAAALEWLVGLGGAIIYEPRFWIQHGNLAMGSISYRLAGGTDPAGQPVELAGRTTEIIRRQPDGTWKYLIDHPFGASKD